MLVLYAGNFHGWLVAEIETLLEQVSNGQLRVARPPTLF
jgi:hypothetical protein